MAENDRAAAAEPCSYCGGKREVAYGTADGLKWKPCPRCAPSAEPVNQCDGCRRGLPLNEHGTHYNPDGSYDRIGCTAGRYRAPSAPAPRRRARRVPDLHPQGERAVRPRSPETEVRRLRTTLRHAKYVLNAWLGNLSITPEERLRGYTRDVLRFIADDLAPKRRRTRPPAGGTEG